ncbi:MAG: dihydrodipicolinate synthase family protein [Acidobacteriota bacterium]
MAVVSNEAPGPFSRMVRAALGGDLATARALHLLLLPLMKANFAESSPIPAKYATAAPRTVLVGDALALTAASETTRARIDAALAEAGLLGEVAP